MPLMTDLREAKAFLEIDPADVSEDKKLGFMIEYASKIIEDYLDRPGLFNKARTEYYGGSGTQRLLLKSRPVYTTPTIAVSVDESGYYGAPTDSFDSNTALTYGTDFVLDVDQEDGTSRSGILVRINATWPRPSVRQNGYLSPWISRGYGTVKVTYTAGYTVDSLPAPFRMAANILVARLRHFMPLGLELTSENYEDRSMSWAGNRKDYLLALVKPLLHQYRNWNFGGPPT